MRLSIPTLACLGLLVVPALAWAQPNYYWPAAPAYPPYYPPLNYGPGNHYPHPFQRWYPEHPYAHLYYPYTYLPYSAYYQYPTLNVYGTAYNPYAPPPALRFPGVPPIIGELVPAPAGVLPRPEQAPPPAPKP